MRDKSYKLFFWLGLILCLIITNSCKTYEKKMMVTTGDISNLSFTSVDISGTVADIGEGATQHGHCYGTSPDVTVAGPNQKTQLGVPAIGGFTSNITNLEPGTQYYMKAYISDGIQTVYGSEITFTTLSASIPVLTTTIPGSITSTTATSGGNISSDGGAAVIERGLCWSTTTGPTTANSKTIDGAGTGSFVSSMINLTPATTYYIRAYAINSKGTAYGDEQNLTTAATTSLVIGQSYQGGKIAYIFLPGDPGYVSGQTHGIIAATNDQSTGIVWWNGSYTTTGATSTALGTGNANTNIIVANQGSGNYAAKLCSDLNEKGFSDWYLPSKDELNKLYVNASAIGNFSSSSFYWSSSEFNSNNSWYQAFADGGQLNFLKANGYNVRAVRPF